MTRIADLEQEIRDRIDAPRKHLEVSADSARYYKLCSCLDVIGDTDAALDAFEEMSDRPTPGSSYILVYGFLQALVLQQDAVRGLLDALGLPWAPDPRLVEIRKVRNEAVGHPTNLHSGKFSFISRRSVSKSGFELMTLEPNEWPPVSKYHLLKPLLDTQRTQLAKKLDALLQALRKEEKEHRLKFRGEKLAALFSWVPYYFEKVNEAVRGSRAWNKGAVHVSSIVEVVEDFKAALERRQITGAYAGVEDQLQRLEPRLAQLHEFFEEKGEGRFHPGDLVRLTSFVQGGMSKLREMAREIDDDYAAEP